MSTSIEEDGFGYVSPADFDEPGTPDEDVKPKDEVDLPVLEEVVVYLDRQIDKCSRIDSLVAINKTNGLTLEQQLAVQTHLKQKLETIKEKITAVIEGIGDKYDETRG